MAKWQGSLTDSLPLMAHQIMSATTAYMFAAFLLRNRDLRIGAFYWLRRMMWEHLFLSTMICLGGFYICLCHWWVHVRTYTHVTVALWGFDRELTAIQFSERVKLMSMPWDIPMRDVGEAVVWCLVSGVIVAWLLPMIAKRDWGDLVLCVTAIAAPLFGRHLGVLSGLLSEELKAALRHVPSPVDSLLLASLLFVLKKRLDIRVGHSVVCGHCRLRIKRTDNYCPQCGVRNPEGGVGGHGLKRPL